MEGRRIQIRGTVQGVGFRPWVVKLARSLGVDGKVWNDAAGVVIEAFASGPTLERFVGELKAHPPPAAKLREFGWEEIRGEPERGFDIHHSEVTEERRVTIPPDLPTCAECSAELKDPANRRYRYPFTNCTNCGPRYTIVRGLPYDRPQTTMAPFRMCPDCQREYDDVEDRRFHAQPNACPVCGPKLWLLAPDGTRVESQDPLRDAVKALREGKILALKGLGGFHLACLATNGRAVQTLRERKRREEKPFAVMVRTLEQARALAELTPAEEALLQSVQRPIVLTRRRVEGGLAGNVAPGLQKVGVMLPYTPLHFLLLEEVALPLVMTSGNLSDEPIVKDNADAVERLGVLADLVLVHDREIEARADDSVSMVVRERPLVMRRSRGYVADGIRLATRLAAPVLACGAQLKNTFCLATGEAAYLSAHIGDLDNLETLQAFEEAVGRMERLLKIRPEVVAHDLHPEYLSTCYAKNREGVRHVGVQHHHAHVVSAMAEHGLTGKVLGLAYDGTGLGTDGTAWGSELLLADVAGFERLATFRPLPLPGGDRAIRDVWRIALVLLDDAYDGAPPLEALELFAGEAIHPMERELVRQMVREQLNAPLAHGAGRYFDALGAIVLGRPKARYEGQVAIALEQAADRAEPGRYPFELDTRRPTTWIDLRAAVRAAVEDLIAGRARSTVAARFHHTLVAASAEVVRAAVARHGALPVVMSGGVFQNAWMVEGLHRELSGSLALHVHSEVPAGDGGLALGQAVIADAIVRGGTTRAA